MERSFCLRPLLGWFNVRALWIASLPAQRMNDEGAMRPTRKQGWADMVGSWYGSIVVLEKMVAKGSLYIVHRYMEEIFYSLKYNNNWSLEASLPVLDGVAERIGGENLIKDRKWKNLWKKNRMKGWSVFSAFNFIPMCTEKCKLTMTMPLS